jgi:hypothetical protein
MSLIVSCLLGTPIMMFGQLLALILNNETATARSLTLTCFSALLDVKGLRQLSQLNLKLRAGSFPLSAHRHHRVSSRRQVPL